MPALTIGPLAADEVLVFSWDTGVTDDGAVGAGHSGEDHLAPCPYKQMPLVAAVINNDVVATDQGWQITLQTDLPAFFVTLEADCEGRFSDNGFLLRPGHPRTVYFCTANDTAAPQFTLRHLQSATYGTD